MKEEEIPILTPIKKNELECDIKKKNETTLPRHEEIWVMFLLITLICFVFFNGLYFLCNNDSRSILTFELVCKTSDPNKIQQRLSNFTATANSRYYRYEYLSKATAEFLLGVPDQYFSARTSFSNGFRLSKEWDAYYESLAVETTEQYFVMNRKSNSTTPEDNIQYVAVKLILAIAWSYEIPTIKTFGNVIEALRFINSIASGYSTTFKDADLFWTRPLNDVKDVPSLNLIHLPQLE